MIYIVLDDCIASIGLKGLLPAGKNGSEEIANSLIRLLNGPQDVVLYDGRDASGTKALKAPAGAAQELARRLLTRYGSDGMSIRLDCCICLDVKWFDDMEYGIQLLRLLSKNPLFKIRKVIVLSLYTDSVIGRQFQSEFNIPKDNMLVRGAVGWDFVAELMLKV